MAKMLIGGKSRRPGGEGRDIYDGAYRTATHTHNNNAAVMDSTGAGMA